MCICFSFKSSEEYKYWKLFTADFLAPYISSHTHYKIVNKADGGTVPSTNSLCCVPLTLSSMGVQMHSNKTHLFSSERKHEHTHKGRMQSSQQTEFCPISRDTWIKEKGNISLMAECCGWLAHAGYGYLQSHMCTAHLLCVCVV